MTIALCIRRSVDPPRLETPLPACCAADAGSGFVAAPVVRRATKVAAIRAPGFAPSAGHREDASCSRAVPDDSRTLTDPLSAAPQTTGHEPVSALRSDLASAACRSR